MSLKPSMQSPLLTEIVEPSAPAAISWLPQSTGWLCVFALLCLYLAYRVYLKIKQYQANAYRRAALAELASLEKLEVLPVLIRRAALYAYPRADVASLIGRDWEKWLDQRCAGSHFSTQFAGLLSSLAYMPSSALQDKQIEQFKAQVAHWLKHHEVNHD